MKFEKNESKIFSDICIPDIFVSEYLPMLDNQSVKVYLYILYASKNKIEISPLDLSKRIGCDLESVKNAFSKLEQLELLTKSTKGYILNDIREIEINKIYIPKLTSSLEDANNNANKNKNRLKTITLINNTYFQGLMSPTWYTDIDMMITKYNFSEEVLIALFKYCFDRAALNKNYVKTVANSWHSNKIETYDDLEKYYINYEKCNEIKKKITKKLNISRKLTQYEEAYIEKWTNEFIYDFNIIELALKKTTTKTNPSFSYIDKILTDWHDKNLKTSNDIKKYLEGFDKKEKLIKENKGKNINAYNHSGRKYDDLSKFYDNINTGGEN